MKIYTKTGDRGETGLVGGRRIPKTDPRIQAIGDVDELNAWLGLARAESPEHSLSSEIEAIQAELFEIGAELASEPGSRVSFAILRADSIERLEGSIDSQTGELEPLRHFILPGGSMLASVLHLARAVCRRAERSVLELAAQTEIRGELLAYLNRLSDWLFVAARTANRAAGVQDIAWSSKET